MTHEKTGDVSVDVTVEHQAGESSAAGVPAGRRDVVVGITGASGALYALTVIQQIVRCGLHAHVVASPLGRRLLADELDITRLDADALGVASAIRDSAGCGQFTLHNYNDVGSILASGGFRTRGMIIVPCSSNTLGQIASGIGDNLIARAAAVTLKERRRLVLVYREMPISRIDLQNALRIDDAGGIFCAANPGFYLRPTSIQELVNMVAGKALDLLDIDHPLQTRWGEHPSLPEDRT